MSYIAIVPLGFGPNYMNYRSSPRMLGNWADCGNGHFILGDDVSGLLMKVTAANGIVVSRAVRKSKPLYSTVVCTFARHYDDTYSLDVVIQTLDGTIRNTLWHITRDDIDSVKKFVMDNIKSTHTHDVLEMIDKISVAC